jgi:hypothetical protein
MGNYTILNIGDYLFNAGLPLFLVFVTIKYKKTMDLSRIFLQQFPVRKEILKQHPGSSKSEEPGINSFLYYHSNIFEIHLPFLYSAAKHYSEV